MNDISCAFLCQYLERCSRFEKAINTRMKEIKLVKTTLEETSEIIVDTKDRKKEKRFTNDRNKRKIENLKILASRDRTKVVSKRKLKDEFPELQTVESKFFDIVKMVMSK